MTAYEDGLAVELEGYERSGNKDRAGQVRAELARVSADPVPPEPVSVTDDPKLAADDPESAPKPHGRARKTKG